MSANDWRLTRAAADVQAETAALEDIEAQLALAQAAVTHAQAELDDIIKEQRDPGRRYRPCELAIAYQQQLAACKKARQRYRELLNTRHLRGT
jgi:multidrug resistance efflux pump